MKKVTFKAPVLTQSGYGVHARQVARWLFTLPNIDLKIVPTNWGDTPWYIDGGACNGFIGKVMEKCSGEHVTSDVMIQLLIPNEWDRKSSDVLVGMTAGIETTKCSDKWLESCSAVNVNHIVVPSMHAKRSLSLDDPKRVLAPSEIVHESFSECILTSKPNDDIKFSTPFNFLLIGQLTGTTSDTDRKNVFWTLKWLCEAFKDDKDVGIVIKTNHGRNTPIDRTLVKNIMTQLLAQVRKGPYPRFHLLHGDMSDEEVAGLYKNTSVKALVSLSRGEGFGLPILEAAASDLPVIVTNWSAPVEYLSAGKFISVDYDMQNVSDARVDGTIFVRGARWAQAREDDFKKKVLKFRSSHIVPKEWAVDLGKKLRVSHSPDAINAEYDASVLAKKYLS